MPSSKILQKESAPLAAVLERFQARLKTQLTPFVDVSLEGRRVVEANLHRPGFVLTGYTDLFQFQRIQVLGNTEARYLASLSPEARSEAVNRLFSYDVPCVVFTNGNVPGEDVQALAIGHGIPLFGTDVATTRFMGMLGEFLDDLFAPHTSVHASLVDIYGVGVLLMGKSGIGKSEVALDLVERGHRLVADDVVIVTKTEANVLMGSGTDLVQHFMEIRGLGLIDVRAMFGVRATRQQKRVELVVQMTVWDDDEEYTRLGMVDDHYTLMDVPLPLVKLPITPGKNITVICEVIAMNHLLRHVGYDAAKVFADRLAEKMQRRQGGPVRATEFFENDTE